jgi:predicted SnoaL-like aldol condensation-catalyzing enzyme/truncated hemoglobin YjbI
MPNEPSLLIFALYINTMKKIAPNIFLLLAGLTIQGQINNTKLKKMTNLEIVTAINRAVQEGDAETVASLVKENYIQHTPVVPDGRKGLVGFVTKIKKKELPAPQIKNIRAMEDGEYIILHHDVSWPGKKAMFEIFRMEDGLAAEHWSGIMDQPDKTVSGHSMLDGATMIKDRANTQKNKDLAKSFVEIVLINGQFDKILDFYHPDIIQHNPFFDNTVPGLIKGVQELQKKGITLQIQKIQQVFGEGNLALVCSEGLFSGKHTAFFDLFRMENNKIVEHWDVLQEIPNAHSQAHTNGFFEATLYKRLGGYDAICGFVDLAFPKVAAHPNLEKYFIGHATESKFRQRQLIIDKLSNTLQGPTIYLGRPLEAVHKGLGITAEEWNSFMNILTVAMDERGIKGKEKADFTDLFEKVFRPLTVESEIKR